MGLTQQAWPYYLADETSRARCLAGLLRDGFFVLRDVPCHPGMVLTVAGSSMGFVEGRTNQTSVRARSMSGSRPPRPTSRSPACPSHRNRIRSNFLAILYPVPTVELLHCLDAIRLDPGGAAAAGKEHPMTVWPEASQ